jgi:hypothetical protein
LDEIDEIKRVEINVDLLQLEENKVKSNKPTN